jgi:hypothetical protein
MLVEKALPHSGQITGLACVSLWNFNRLEVKNALLQTL